MTSQSTEPMVTEKLIRAQQAEIELLRIDAGRYRWLRDHIALTICARIDKTITHGTPEKMDELIDARLERRRERLRDFIPETSRE